MGAGSAHSSPLMVMNQRMQQSVQSVMRMFPLNVTRSEESVVFLLREQERVLRGPLSLSPSEIGEGKGQCFQRGW